MYLQCLGFMYFGILLVLGVFGDSVLQILLKYLKHFGVRYLLRVGVLLVLTVFGPSVLLILILAVFTPPIL